MTATIYPSALSWVYRTKDTTKALIDTLFRVDHWRTARSQNMALQQTPEGSDWLATWGYLCDCVQGKMIEAAANRCAHTPSNPAAILGEFGLPGDVRFIKNKWRHAALRGTKQGMFDMLNSIGYPASIIYFGGQSGNQYQGGPSLSGYALSPYWPAAMSTTPPVASLTRYAGGVGAWFTVMALGMPTPAQPIPPRATWADPYVPPYFLGQAYQGRAHQLDNITPRWSAPRDDRELIVQIGKYHQRPFEWFADAVFYYNKTTTSFDKFSDTMLHVNLSSNDAMSIYNVDSPQMGYNGGL